VESAIAAVDAVIHRCCSSFLEIQTNGPSDIPLAEQTVRDLAFLERWRGGLRGVYSRLI